jgi:pyridoxal phosphate enzyme (YggS family)
MQQALTRSGRRGEEVRLIGVTKKKSPEDIVEAFKLGLGDFGENYVQEWQDKQARLGQTLGAEAHNLTWHFIGHLQSNKVKAVVGQVDWIQTVDSIKLAEKISRSSGENGCIQKVLIEVNIAGESGKSGFSPETLRKSLGTLAKLPHISWRGLMAVPPEVEDPQANRPHFRYLKSLLDEYHQTGVFNEAFMELSMGMSHDFDEAIEEGATMIRIGTALFGPRE